jgi:hypothetical protein
MYRFGNGVAEDGGCTYMVDKICEEELMKFGRFIFIGIV